MMATRLSPSAIVLITGVAGFTGRHMARLLHAEGMRVVGVARSAPAEPVAAVDELLLADLRDADAVHTLVAAVRPQAIIHLAALLRSSDLGALLAANVAPTQLLCAAASGLAEPPRLFIAGSAAEYGQPDPDVAPIVEDHPPRPLSPYGVSKLAQTAVGLLWGQRGLPVYVGRLFNCLGPGEPPTMVCSAMARQVALIQAGQSPPLLRVGSLEAERDFLDIRDVVRAYWAIIQGGQAGRVYNVCSGTAVSIARLPGMLLAAAGVAAEVQSAEVGAGVRRSVGDASRLRGELGWRAQHTLEASLRDLLASWQARLRRELAKEPA
jgi:GDP-4-dehydro-6-deoxy-D-mannose reductase